MKRNNCWQSNLFSGKRLFLPANYAVSIAGQLPLVTYGKKMRETFIFIRAIGYLLYSFCPIDLFPFALVAFIISLDYL